MARKRRRTRKTNGAGSITKLSGYRSKPWMVRGPAEIQVDGSIKRQIIGYYATSEDAEMALAKYKINPFDLDEKDTTFDELFQIFIKDKVHNVTLHTQRALQNLYSIHFQNIKTKSIRKIKFSELQAILNVLPKNTSNRAKSIIIGVYKIAMKNNIVDKDISQLLETSKFKTIQYNRDIFTNDIIKKIREISKTHKDKNIQTIADMVMILLYSGMRTIEIRNIRIENIHFNQNYMIGGSKTEAGRDRIIPIHPKIKDLIEKYYNKDNEFLFINRLGGPFGEDHFKKNFRALREIIGFEQTAYSTRHTFITALQKLNISEEKIKKIVGHKTTDITSGVYTHYEPSDFVGMIKDVDYGD